VNEGFTPPSFKSRDYYKLVAFGAKQEKTMKDQGLGMMDFGETENRIAS